MQYLDNIIAHYGWGGVSLTLLVVVLFVIQLFYYLMRYRKVGSYLNNKSRRRKLESMPPVTVVIPMFSEDYSYIEDTLPLIMGQEGVRFEVVLVYVGSDGDFYEDIVRLKQVLSNIIITKIERNDRFPISVKTALNVGIKAARNEHVVFTTTDARPASTKWLSLMSKGFQRGDVVLGYCGMEPQKGFAAQYIRLSRLWRSMNWLSSAVSGAPYRAIRSNMGFTKSLYFGAKGFSHLNMNIGEDDLFLQKIMNRENTSIVLAPRATMTERRWGGLAWWIDQMRYYCSADKLYPLSAQNFERWEMASRVLLFVATLAMVALLPLELKGFAVLLLIVRVVVMLVIVNTVSKRLGEKGVVWSYLLFDAVNPLFVLYLKVRMLKRDKRVWR